MNSELPGNENISSIFQENVCIRGDLELSQPLLLDGKLYGNISSKSHVIIGEKGYVEGQIQADKVTMWGRIKGNIIAHSLCILQNMAKVEGDISSSKLAMKEGAEFSGFAKIKEPEKMEPEVKPEPVNRFKVDPLKGIDESVNEPESNIKIKSEY